jgi:hypothetical protein
VLSNQPDSYIWKWTFGWPVLGKICLPRTLHWTNFPGRRKTNRAMLAPGRPDACVLLRPATRASSCCCCAPLGAGPCGTLHTCMHFDHGVLNCLGCVHIQLLELARMTKIGSAGWVHAARACLRVRARGEQPLLLHTETR